MIVYVNPKFLTYPLLPLCSHKCVCTSLYIIISANNPRKSHPPSSQCAWTCCPLTGPLKDPQCSDLFSLVSTSQVCTDSLVPDAKELIGPFQSMCSHTGHVTPEHTHILCFGDCAFDAVTPTCPLSCDPFKASSVWLDVFVSDVSLWGQPSILTQAPSPSIRKTDQRSTPTGNTHTCYMSTVMKLPMCWFDKLPSSYSHT